MTPAATSIGQVLPREFEYRPELARSATSRQLRSAPRHRWFYFPHSYSYRLVNEVLDYWCFRHDAILADNFAGSGTTLLAARERGLSALGFDLSPLAVMVTNTKTSFYEIDNLKIAFQQILDGGKVEAPQIPKRLSRAFTRHELREIFRLLDPIRAFEGTIQSFFLVALLWSMKAFSRAVPDGGWFRWREWSDRSSEIREAFQRTVRRMIADVDVLNWYCDGSSAHANLADARELPLLPASVDGLITSPPYANRHDYSRVFHIDLLLLGLGELEVTRLRHESLRSHVEAHGPLRHMSRLAAYAEPEALETVLDELPDDADPRIRRLLTGYFEDIYLSLLEVSRVLRPGGRAAYVVGNVRHAGVMVPVDEITAELANVAGLDIDAVWVMRLRGNSAQQMGHYGRVPARESIVLMSKGSPR